MGIGHLLITIAIIGELTRRRRRRRRRRKRRGLGGWVGG